MNPYIVADIGGTNARFVHSLAMPLIVSKTFLQRILKHQTAMISNMLQSQLRHMLVMTMWSSPTFPGRLASVL